MATRVSYINKSKMCSGQPLCAVEEKNAGWGWLQFEMKWFQQHKKQNSVSGHLKY